MIVQITGQVHGTVYKHDRLSDRATDHRSILFVHAEWSVAPSDNPSRLLKQPLETFLKRKEAHETQFTQFPRETDLISSTPHILRLTNTQQCRNKLTIPQCQGRTGGGGGQRGPWSPPPKHTGRPKLKP